MKDALKKLANTAIDTLSTVAKELLGKAIEENIDEKENEKEEKENK